MNVILRHTDTYAHMYLFENVHHVCLCAFTLYIKITAGTAVSASFLSYVESFHRGGGGVMAWSRTDDIQWRHIV